MIVKRIGTGLVALGLMTVAAQAATYKVNVAALNVRSGPGTGYRILGTLSRGATVNVAARSGSWARISSPRSGYVYGPYLAASTYSSQPAASSSTSETGARIVKWALTRVGDPYSQARRGTGRYVDCSYFAWWSYHMAGVTSLKLSTAAGEALQCVNRGVLVPASQRKPGDLIFWRRAGCRCGRYREIHHVGIYIGNGRSVEASSGAGRVVVRAVWSSRSYPIAFYARPHRN